MGFIDRAYVESKKWEVLNAIDDELIRRDSYQGKFNIREGVLS